MNKIVIIGSSNTDMVVQSEHLPVPGETVLGNQFMMNSGGKGANQAVAASKLEGDVTFIAKIGCDVFGEEAIKGFQSHNINTDFIISDKESPSGVALIMVDANGENCISVALGANAELMPSDIDQALPIISKAQFILIQLEIPLETVEHAVSLANHEKVNVVLNPAPARALSDDLLASLYCITPNEIEAEILTGIKVNDKFSAKKAAEILLNKGVEVVIITMGSQGAYILSDSEDSLVPCPAVKAVDTTAAGDTFNGALVVGLADGLSLVEAVKFANLAAAFSVTKMGAQTSAPTRKELVSIA